MTRQLGTDRKKFSRQMKSLTDKYGARMIVIGIDNPFSVDQDVYDAYVRPLNDPDFDVEEPLRRLSGILKDNHIEFVNGIPLLRALSKETQSKSLQRTARRSDRTSHRRRLSCYRRSRRRGHQPHALREPLPLVENCPQPPSVVASFAKVRREIVFYDRAVEAFGDGRV